MLEDQGVLGGDQGHLGGDVREEGGQVVVEILQKGLVLGEGLGCLRDLIILRSEIGL